MVYWQKLEMYINFNKILLINTRTIEKWRYTENEFVKVIMTALVLINSNLLILEEDETFHIV